MIYSKKTHKLVPPQVERAVEMYKQGLSLKEIANHFSVTKSGMWGLLRRRTEMRPKLRYGADNAFFLGDTAREYKAHNLVVKAVKDGILQRPDICDQCGAKPTPKDGKNGIHAHHSDYTKPQEVMWLCRKCHYWWHRNNKPVHLVKK